MLQIRCVKMALLAVLAAEFSNVGAAVQDAAMVYPWLPQHDAAQSLEKRFAPPTGYERVKVEAGSFMAWLRGLPLKPGTPPVHLYDGRRKDNQDAHCAVVELDVGKENLQQCADAVIRLRAEYLYAKQDYAAISFNFTSGDAATFSRWADGWRPVVKRNVTWAQTGKKGRDYDNFRQYLRTVFIYAGSDSLSRQLQPVAKIQDMRIGDMFIRGGSPGHVVLVLDMAEHPKTGRKIFLLGQSYMPAQDFQVLKNPNDAALSPWYDSDFGDELRTPEWKFKPGELKRFSPAAPGGR